MATSTRWDEVEGRIREVADPRQRAHLLSRLACAMVDEQRERARSLAVEVLNQSRPEEGATPEILRALVHTRQTAAALEWIDAKAGGADPVIEESIRIAGWVRADWQRLSSRFPDCTEAHGERVL